MTYSCVTGFTSFSNSTARTRGGWAAAAPARTRASEKTAENAKNARRNGISDCKKTIRKVTRGLRERPSPPYMEGGLASGGRQFVPAHVTHPRTHRRFCDC